MLLTPSIIDDAMLAVKPHQFADHRSGMVCRVMFDLRQKSKTVDTIAVFRGLKALGVADNDSGPEEIARFMEDTPHSGHWRYHASLVRDAFIRRELQVIASDIGHSALDVSRETSELVSDADGKIRGLLEKEAAINEPSSMMDVLIDLKSNRDQGIVRTGLTSGYADLDGLTGGLFRGQLVIVAARPSVGKTALALNMAKRMGEHGLHTLLVSIEQSKDEIGERFVAMESGLSLYDLRRTDLSEQDHYAITEAYNRIANLPIWIEDASGLTPTAISALARVEKRRRQLDCVIVDYLQLVQPDDRRVPREQQVAESSRKFKYIAKDLDVPVIVLAQLNRKSEEAGTSKAKSRPQLWHLRESGAIEQDADQVWLLWAPKADDVENSIMRDDEPPPAVVSDAASLDVEIVVAKNRNGKTGTAKLWFRKSCFRFEAIHHGESHEWGDERLPYPE